VNFYVLLYFIKTYLGYYPFLLIGCMEIVLISRSCRSLFLEPLCTNIQALSFDCTFTKSFSLFLEPTGT